MSPKKPKNYEISDSLDDRAETHLKIGKRNEQFYKLLTNSNSDYHIWEWMVTIVFYSSLHYIKSLLIENYEKSPEDINRHYKIKQVMKNLANNDDLKYNIFEQYEKLKNNSMVTRYKVFSESSTFEDGFLITLAAKSYNEQFSEIRDYVLDKIPEDLKSCI